ncbi:manganese peroxidase 3 [Russula brevipes]|nr:manganese peroxidase 3 [Russula brevipes]
MTVFAAALVRRVTCPNGGVTANEACCVLFPILKDIQKNLFDGGECGEDAHSALRLAFHDAIGYSMSQSVGGGADGSIIKYADIETKYPANGGTMISHNISEGDFIQFAAAVGLTNCPGAPRIGYQYGRPTAACPANDILVDKILGRFADVGFGPAAVVSLLASHSIAAADAVDTSVPGAPFDSTPGTFDSQIYVETLLKGERYPGNGDHKGERPAPGALKGEMRLESDYAIARDPRTACEWQRHIEDGNYMRSSFKKHMEQLAVLGQDVGKLVDCSDVIPESKPYSGKPRLPAGTSSEDIEQSCSDRPFPHLTADPGPPRNVEPV